MELDYHAPVELTQAALPAMRERRAGWIVNVSSVVARHPEPAPFTHVLPMTRIGWHYGAVKAALERFTTGLATEVYDDRIAVNALLPVAGVRTPAFEAISARVTAPRAPGTGGADGRGGPRARHRRPGGLDGPDRHAAASCLAELDRPVHYAGRIVDARHRRQRRDNAAHRSSHAAKERQVTRPDHDAQRM